MLHDWEELLGKLSDIRDHCNKMNRSEHSEIIDHTYAVVGALIPLVEMVATDGDYEDVGDGGFLARAQSQEANRINQQSQRHG